jgi:ATP phosphoribosyltransferase
MLTASEIIGSGFTLIADDQTADERSQESINEMFQELRDVLNNHGFDISIVANQEDAMRFQGRLLFKKMFDKLDLLCRDE